ncbi:unnamed protein product [Ambrosiozyma monospora]|uniref:Unnamed protein product n=1 Tax=Ambrosiozyma monospora TaxID=43982 RepID=A0A9W7DKY2_AMBMO|nr:unnamed protein product [Ambrosiozyma monospora]
MVRLLYSTEDRPLPPVTTQRANSILKDDYLFTEQDFEYGFGLFQNLSIHINLELVPQTSSFSTTKAGFDVYLYCFPNFKISGFRQHHDLLQSDDNRKVAYLKNGYDGFERLDVVGTFKKSYSVYRDTLSAFLFPVCIEESHWVTVWIPLDGKPRTGRKSSLYITIYLLDSITPDTTKWGFLTPIKLMLERFLNCEAKIHVECIVPYMQHDNSSSGPITMYYLQRIVKHYCSGQKKIRSVISEFQRGYGDRRMTKLIGDTKQKLHDYMSVFSEEGNDLTASLIASFKKSAEYFERREFIERYVRDPILTDYLTEECLKVNVNHRDYFYFNPFKIRFAPSPIITKLASYPNYSAKERRAVWLDYFLKLFNIDEKTYDLLGISSDIKILYNLNSIKHQDAAFQKAFTYDQVARYYKGARGTTTESKVFLKLSQLPKVILKRIRNYQGSNLANDVQLIYSQLGKYPNISMVMVHGVVLAYLDAKALNDSDIEGEENAYNSRSIDLTPKRYGECLFLSVIHRRDSERKPQVMFEPSFDGSSELGTFYDLPESEYSSNQPYSTSFELVSVDIQTRKMNHFYITQPATLISVVTSWIKLFRPRVIQCDDSSELFNVNLKRLCQEDNITLLHGCTILPELTTLQNGLYELINLAVKEGSCDPNNINNIFQNSFSSMLAKYNANMMVE